MKIVVLDGYTENPGDLSWDGIREFGDVTIYDRTPNNTDDVVERISDAEVVFVNKVNITREILDKCENIRFIGILATGYNIIDVDACKDKGIFVSNVPSYSTDSVAQFTFALLLEACHHVGHHSQAVVEGRWTKSKDFCFWDCPMMELSGKTMGIIGFGQIGQATAKIAKAFGMKVLAYSRHKVDNVDFEQVSLDEIYKNADIISLHCPYNKDSDKIINKTSIDKMKDGVIIINTARGGLLNEQDVADALNSNKIAYLCADVVSAEPIKTDNPLLKAQNVIITPHLAWASKEARTRLMEITVDNLRAYVNGKPQNIVNL